MIDLEEAIDFSRSIMLKDSFNGIFGEYSKAFFSTTEYISEYLKRESHNKDRALTVLASGDHVFNLIHEGVRNIDAFDINKLEYYIYFLKRAFLLTLPRDAYTFLNASFGNDFNLDEKMEIIKNLKNNLPEDVYEYFLKILEYAKCKKDAKLSNLFTPVYVDIEKTNNYLKSEEDYKKTCRLLSEASINLYFEDALDIPTLVSPGYDIILLSNIADYLCQRIDNFDIWDFEKYIDSFYKLLNRDGLLINYLFGLDCGSIILGTCISKSDLPDNAIVKLNATKLGQGYMRVRKRK